MAYDGYFLFGGTELINAERTKRYLRHALPAFGIAEDCCDCPDLDVAAGDEDGYSSPMTDPAPWYSPYSPGSGEFYGLLPLSVEGVDDGTVGATVTELTTDGAVLSRTRKSSRTIRFTGLLVGASDKALDTGMAWIKSVLAGSDCSDGDCGGDELCYLAACPQWCPPDVEQTVVLDMPYDRVTKTGWELGPDTRFGNSSSFTFLAARGSRPQVSWRMGGLVGGGVYRVTVETHTSQKRPVVVSVPGAVHEEHTIGASEIAGHGPYMPLVSPPGGGTGVFEFTASAGVQRLVITGEPGDSVGLFRVLVERVADTGLVLTTTPAAGEPSQVGAWTMRGGSGDDPLPFLERVYGRAKAVVGPDGGDVNLPALTPSAERTITGLIPGRRYTITAGVISSTRTTSSPASEVDGGVRMLVDNGAVTNVPVVWTQGPWWDLQGGWGGWVQLSFVATERAHTVTLGPDLPRTILEGSGGSSTFEVQYLRVEDNLVGVPIRGADPADGLRRHLRNVSAVSGPTVVGEFDLQVGAMRQIEFTLVAGDPRPMGDPRSISTVLGPGVSVVPEMECSFGEPVLVNHLFDSTFEVPGFLGAWQFSKSGTLTANFTVGVLTVEPVHASRVGRMQVTGSGTGTLNLTNLSMTSVVSATYTVSGYVRSTVTTTVTLGVEFGEQPGTSAQVVVPGGDGWRRVSVTYTAPSELTVVRVSASRDAGWPAGAQVDVDAFMIVDGAQLGPFFTGVWRKTGSSLVVDPDCSPIPAPPRPPLIVNECIEVPSTWRRYSAVIPAQVTAISPWSLPTMSVTSGAEAVRGVRMRMFPNMMGLPVEALNPCSWCGEFIVTYLPANTTLVIDTASRTATMSVDGAQPVSAMHLLYGTGGAPVVWPELTCGIEYVSVVDVDADTPGALVGMELSVTPAY